MFGEDHEAIVQRGIDEAFACQDMLARAPVRTPRWADLARKLVVTARSLARRVRVPAHRWTSAARHGVR
jgi:hypothetical protein